MAKGTKSTGRPPADVEPASSLPEAEGIDVPADGVMREHELEESETIKSAHAAGVVVIEDAESADPPGRTCAKCVALGYRPCSVECYVDAGYKAENYDGFIVELEAAHAKYLAEHPTEASPATIAAPRLAPRAGHTLCKVVGTTVYGGTPAKNHHEGEVGHFSDVDIAAAPEHLIPVEPE